MVPDLALTVNNVVASGDEVFVEWVARGTHEAEALGVPPSHKRVEWGGITWTKICDGRITEFRTYWNASYALRSRLDEALAEIETLKGILPICCHCKRVRNDEGYWEQVESYVSKRSSAEFSHGLCPDCVKAHYPDTIGEL